MIAAFRFAEATSARCNARPRRPATKNAEVAFAPSLFVQHQNAYKTAKIAPWNALVELTSAFTLAVKVYANPFATRNLARALVWVTTASLK